MFQITKQIDYALQLILGLGALDAKTLLSLRTFATESNISFLFLQKIAKQLREAEIIESVKGAHGGYRLAVPMDTITMKMVIEAIEGPYGVVPCLKGHCDKEETCTTKGMFKQMNDHIVSYLENTKVQEYVS